MVKKSKLLLFDLDGTLLRNDKSISKRTLDVLQKYRERGMLIGVSTSRSEQNALSFIEELKPEVLIASGGALVKYKGEYIYRAEFSAEETKQMIEAARSVCGNGCEITIDTMDSHYWNYKMDPKTQDASWGDSIYTDFRNFEEASLKMCVEIFDDGQVKQLQELLKDCDCIRFSDGYWYKFTKKGITKEWAIEKLCAVCGIRTQEIVAFGDDFADMRMLKLCGLGVAMGNAVEEVKEAADVVIGSNEEDGIAEYLESFRYEIQGEEKEKIDFSTITACGESCVNCQKKANGICKGCIEADGYVPEWADSGRCKVHACTRVHNVQFCGICKNFPCQQITSLIHWNPNIVEHLSRLAKQYGEQET